MAVRAEFLNPFLSGAMRTLKAELGLEPGVGSVTATRDALVSAGVSVLIGLTGMVRGVVVYDMEEKTAKAIAGTMAGTTFPIFDEMAESAIAELGNMITGHASGQLEEKGYRVEISPPSVVVGRGTLLTVPGIARIVVPLLLPFGVIQVYLALEGA